MSLIDRAWHWQHVIEHRIRLLPELKLSSYFQFLFLVFFLVGVMLFVYLWFVPVYKMGLRVNPFVDLDLYGDPLFYFGLGLVCFIGFLCARFSKK